MKPKQHTRPDPDELLHAMRRQEESRNAGQLKLFFGMCAGVGKTYEMLSQARQRKLEGIGC